MNTITFQLIKKNKDISAWKRKPFSLWENSMTLKKRDFLCLNNQWRLPSRSHPQLFWASQMSFLTKRDISKVFRMFLDNCKWCLSSSSSFDTRVRTRRKENETEGVTADFIVSSKQWRKTIFSAINEINKYDTNDRYQG